MKINDVTPFRDNEHFSFCYNEKELKDIQDQISGLQNSVALLRKDIPTIILQLLLEEKSLDKSIHSKC